MSSRALLNSTKLSVRRLPFSSRALSTITTTTTTTTTSTSKHNNMRNTRHPDHRVLTQHTINPAVLAAEYAVRGAIALRAETLREELEEGKDLPFDTVVSCNIGNPQQLDQKPLTFLRQIAALTEYPELIDHPGSSSIFPTDARARAKKLVQEVHSVGAYSHSMGVPAIRKRVAEFIAKRDGFPSSASKIYLTAGASVGVANLMQVLISSSDDGVLIPIPQYPLYTAALALNSAIPVPYYLQESVSWGLDIEGIKTQIADSRAEGTKLKAMVVINPGNPTGNCLTRENIEDIIKLCYHEHLVLFADEVYQDNIYLHSRPFESFKKVLKELGEPYSNSLELVSFHSISKGQTGECGRRGGYFELCNFHPEAEEQIYKMASIQLCPPISGQIGVDVLINPPQEGEESYELWTKERAAIAKTLKGRSEVLEEAFNKLEGISCNAAEGAMYLFPTITLPPKAIEAAKAANSEPDAFYSLKLLDATGICVVPGSGFGQQEGTWHFRTTFLAPGTEDYVRRLKEFHEKFMAEYK